jgi:F-type H+-transporting ATPase subunit b
VSKRSLFLPVASLLGVVLLSLSLAAPCAASAQTASTPAPSNSAYASGEPSTPEAQSADKNSQEQDENDAYRHSAMVAKLGGMMGMNPELSATVFEVTNFLLLTVFVLWLIAKMVPGAIRARNSAIQKHLVDARTATAEANARLSSVETRLGKLDEEIAAMRAQAEKDSARDEVRIKAAVEEDKKKILAAAEQEIASATVQAQKQLQRYAAELAIEQAARKLVVTAETDRLLVQGFAERLAGDSSKKGQN